MDGTSRSSLLSTYASPRTLLQVRKRVVCAHGLVRGDLEVGVVVAVVSVDVTQGVVVGAHGRVIGPPGQTRCACRPVVVGNTAGAPPQVSHRITVQPVEGSAVALKKSLNLIAAHTVDALIKLAPRLRRTDFTSCPNSEIPAS